MKLALVPECSGFRGSSDGRSSMGGQGPTPPPPPLLHTSRNIPDAEAPFSCVRPRWIPASADQKPLEISFGCP